MRPKIGRNSHSAFLLLSQAHPPDEYKNDIEEHFNRCINEKRYIETNEIKAIADKITNNQLPKLCHNLGIAEERLQVILCQKHSFLHQLKQNMTTDCLLNYEFSTTNKKTTSSVYVVYIKLFLF